MSLAPGHKALEEYLRKHDGKLAAIYTLAKDELGAFQDRWCARWPEGNDHGRHHIERVLDNLAALVGREPIEIGELSPLDLCLAMMGVVAHDIGVMNGRKDHAKTSARLIKQIAQKNEYVFDAHLLDILVAAIVCHSSSVVIDEACGHLANEEPILGHTVRPYKIVALVRLADELDEDARRAPKQILELIPESSRPYWRFCQCIRGIDLGAPGGEILVNVHFDEEALKEMPVLQGQPFLRFFAEKVAKINRERVLVSPYLGGLVRKRLQVLVSLPPGLRRGFTRPQTFYFDDDMGKSEATAKQAVERFLRAYPELRLAKRGSSAPQRMTRTELCGASLRPNEDTGFAQGESRHRLLEDHEKSHTLSGAGSLRNVQAPGREGPRNNHGTKRTRSSSLGKQRHVVVGSFHYPPFISWITAEPSLSKFTPLTHPAHQLRHDYREPNEPPLIGPWFSAIRSLGEELRLKVSYAHLAIPVFVNERTQRYDIVPGLFKTPHRELLYEFSTPLHRIGLQGICRAGMGPIPKIDIASGKVRVVVQSGEVGWEYAKNEFESAFRNGSIRKLETPVTYEALSMLISGTVDLALADEISCHHFLRTANNAELFKLAFANDRPLQFFDACVAVDRTLGWDMNELNARLRRIRNDRAFLEQEDRALAGFEYIERCCID